MLNSKILKGAVVSGVINGIINGGIQWFSFRKYDEIKVSVDSINNDDFTVLGGAVFLALTLAMILTLVAFLTLKKDQRPSVGTRIWVIIKHGFFTFGVVVGFSVMWQYWLGTVLVSPLVATLLVGLIAGIVALVVNYLTLEPYAE